MEYTPSLASYDENLNRNSSLDKRTGKNSSTEVNKDLSELARDTYHHKSGSFETLVEPKQINPNYWDPKTTTPEERNDTAKFRLDEPLDSPLKVNILSSDPIQEQQTR